MHRTDTVVIGAGQAGLATSHRLTAAGRDHVVLERGRLAERWRSERWDSLHLLTPNWMTRLPGWAYQGDDPTGFMSVADLIDLFEGYAASFAPPVEEQTTVESVRRSGDGYEVRTDQGTWWAANVVIATGHCGHPLVPDAAGGLDPDVHQLTSNRYRNPAELPDGGVLVVGASSTGLQLAEELARAGRDVVLSVGDHTRVPRRYRGMDIFWWLDQMGALEEKIEHHPAPEAARRSPSLQLVGGPEPRDLDLAACRGLGVRLTGRMTTMDGHRVGFAPDLTDSVGRSELRMRRLLDRIDRHVTREHLASEVDPPVRPAPICPPEPLHRLHLDRAGISTVLWATGYGRSYPWLHVPVLDEAGEIRHRRGVTPSPGLYVVGLRFQHRRSSNFIDGVGRDAELIVDHLTARAVTHQEVTA